MAGHSGRCGAGQFALAGCSRREPGRRSGRGQCRHLYRRARAAGISFVTGLGVSIDGTGRCAVQPVCQGRGFSCRVIVGRYSPGCHVRPRPARPPASRRSTSDRPLGGSSVVCHGGMEHPFIFSPAVHHYVCRNAHSTRRLSGFCRSRPGDTSGRLFATDRSVHAEHLGHRPLLLLPRSGKTGYARSRRLSRVYHRPRRSDHRAGYRLVFAV